MNRHFNNRAVSQVIAALLLIAIAVAAAVLLYVFSIGLLGSLGGSGGQQAKQQLILEAYDWSDTGTLTLHLRNVGSAAINVENADFFLGGVKVDFSPTTCPSATAVPPQGSCDGDISTAPLTTISGGVAYVIKIVTPDGAVFSYTALAGQAG